MWVTSPIHQGHISFLNIFIPFMDHLWSSYLKFRLRITGLFQEYIFVSSCRLEDLSLNIIRKGNILFFIFCILLLERKLFFFCLSLLHIHTQDRTLTSLYTYGTSINSFIKILFVDLLIHIFKYKEFKVFWELGFY